MNQPGRGRADPAALALFPLVLVWAAPASAHPAVRAAMDASFAAGFAHPFGGLDHLLAMAAAGVLAARMGGGRVRLLPAAFVAAMIAGFGLARIGLALPWAETGAALSVVALGLAIAGSSRLPTGGCLALVAISGLFHGHAHGGEAAALADPAPFVAGAAAASTILHATGIAFALGVARGRGLGPAGCGVAALGLVLLLPV